ncbi:MAG: S8 family serine peptidase [Holosporaceae bacterium]|nr:MAG: S8 family serine peptidase [Holosporaceae bacterium]
MSAHGISVTSVVYEMAPAVACAVASPTEIRHCFKPSAAERDAFCQKIRKKHGYKCIICIIARRPGTLERTFYQNLRGTDNVLVIAIGNEPHSYRKVVDHFWLFRSIVSSWLEHRIIVAGGIKADYSNAYYVKPNVLIMCQNYLQVLKKTAKPISLCLAKDVPARTERGYGKVNGTSFAAPAITGAIALLKSSNPGLGYSTIMRILLDTGRKTSMIIELMTMGRVF